MLRHTQTQTIFSYKFVLDVARARSLPQAYLSFDSLSMWQGQNVSEPYYFPCMGMHVRIDFFFNATILADNVIWSGLEPRLLD